MRPILRTLSRLSTTTRRMMSTFKTTHQLTNKDCLRVQNTFAQTREHIAQLEKQHAWCDRFCQEICMKSAMEDCYHASKQFCEQNCQQECYFIGPVPRKSVSKE